MTGVQTCALPISIKKDLPEGFQTSEFLLDHGFLDFIVERKDLKKQLSDLLALFKKAPTLAEIGRASCRERV